MTSPSPPSAAETFAALFRPDPGATVGTSMDMLLDTDRVPGGRIFSPGVLRIPTGAVSLRFDYRLINGTLSFAHYWSGGSQTVTSVNTAGAPNGSVAFSVPGVGADRISVRFNPTTLSLIERAAVVLTVIQVPYA